MRVWSATFSYRCLYLGLVQCKIVNLHFRDFPFERTVAFFNSHSDFLGSGCNLITCANVLRGSQMSVDIQRVIPGVMIVTCCNMNPLSCWKNLSSDYSSQCLKRSFDDSIKEFVVHNPYRNSVTRNSVAEYWSILASGLNPAHQCDWVPCVQVSFVRKLNVAANSAIKHVRSAWLVVGSACNPNISQDFTEFPVLFFCSFIANI